jgi:predicted SprT family Zn-dependent metalloprotease
MTEAQVRDLAEELFGEHLTDTCPYTGVAWKFDISNHKTAIGQCNYVKGTIFYSRHWLHLSYSEILEVVLHEIAHALTPGEGHNRKWKAMAVKVGATPKRCQPVHQDNCAAPYNWLFQCHKCNLQWRRYRNKFKRGARCAKCNGDIEIIKL